REYRGNATTAYRLHLGPIPLVTGAFPLGVPRGKQTPVTLLGVNLGSLSQHPVMAAPPADAVVGAAYPLPLPAPPADRPAPLGKTSVVVGEFAEVRDPGTALLEPPATANGLVLTPGAQDSWKFRARKGERLLVEVQARRLGSPLDSVIEIVDE